MDIHSKGVKVKYTTAKIYIEMAREISAGSDYSDAEHRAATKMERQGLASYDDACDILMDMYDNQKKFRGSNSRKEGKSMGKVDAGLKPSTRMSFRIETGLHERFREMSRQTGKSMTWMLVGCIMDRVESWEHTGSVSDA